MINLRNRLQRIREMRSIHRVMHMMENLLRRRLQAEFKRTIQAVVSSYPNWTHLMTGHEQRLRSILRTSLITAARASSYRARETSRKALYSHLEKKLDTTEELDARVVAWAEDHAAKRVVGVSKTTRTRINDCIARGLEDNLHPNEIAKLIEDEVGDMEMSRAQTIARTETHAAVMTGQHLEMEDVAKELNMEMYKTWTATEDENTRESHASADGQSTRIDEPFTVGEDELDYPGDPSGSPEETINCRCVAVYGVLR